MTTNQYISISLLIGRLVTIYIMVLVIRKQRRALKSTKYPELRDLRKTLLVGSVILLLANFVPVLIDTLGLFNKGSFGLLLAYVFSNNLTAIFAAYMLWYNLRLAERIKISDKE